MISCLRPVALTASTTFWSSHVLMKVRSITSWPGNTSVIWGNRSPPRSAITSVQDGGHGEGLGGLGQTHGVVDHHLRLVTVHVRQLVGLVVDQHEHRVFGTQERSEAVSKSSMDPWLPLQGHGLGGNVPAAMPAGCPVLRCRYRCGSSIRWASVSPFEERKVDIENSAFVEVAHAGGVSAAATRLGISKSMVSRRLFRLEAELGVQLLS